MVELRVACDDPKCDQHNCGREPTRDELWAYAEAKGWIDYEASYKESGVLVDDMSDMALREGSYAVSFDGPTSARSIVDAALRGEQ